MRQNVIDLKERKKVFKKKTFVQKYLGEWKEFTKTIVVILIIGFLVLSYGAKVEKKKIDEKNQEILTLLNRGITSFNEFYGFYPESLQKLEDKEIIKPLDLILNKSNIHTFFYKKTETGFILEIKK